MEKKLSIVSDFDDFYDELCSMNSTDKPLYVRKLGEQLTRGRALARLKQIGIPTIEVGAVTRFDETDKLVVYTDVTKHGGKGKRICSYEEAVSQYRNYLASRYIERYNGVTVKMLQIGKRSYKLTYINPDNNSLDMGRLVDISRGADGYNMLLMKPIYSIDYIWDCSGAAYAVDLNEVQNLKHIEADKFISSEEVVDEIIEAIEVYRKGAIRHDM